MIQARPAKGPIGFNMEGVLHRVLQGQARGDHYSVLGVTPAIGGEEIRPEERMRAFLVVKSLPTTATKLPMVHLFGCVKFGCGGIFMFQFPTPMDVFNQIGGMRNSSFSFCVTLATKLPMVNLFGFAKFGCGVCLCFSFLLLWMIPTRLGACATA